MVASGGESRVAIVGASFAGISAAEELLRNDDSVSVEIFSAERYAPYDRPELSKSVLFGQSVSPPLLTSNFSDRFQIRSEALEEVSFHEYTVRTVAGESEHFSGGIVYAAGVRPRTIINSPSGLHKLRVFDDALELRESFGGFRSGHLIIVGAGFIGLEVAAAAITQGSSVTVIGTTEAPLGNLVPPEVGWKIAMQLGAKGVVFKCGVQVESYVGSDPVTGVVLDGGEEINGDGVLLAIGDTPNTEIIMQREYVSQHGVLADQTLRVAPRVVAAGDVAYFFDETAKGHVRRRHWDNAVRSGRHAAQTLLAELGQRDGEAYAYTPWMWSDIGTDKLQMLGDISVYDETRLLLEKESRRYVYSFLLHGKIVGLLAINASSEIVRWRRYVNQGISLSDLGEQVLGFYQDA